MKSNLQKKGDSSKDPLGRFLFGAQVERPDVGVPPLPGLVHRALVQLAQLLLVLCHRSDVDDRHQRVELLEPRLCDEPGRCVPPGALHVQPVGESAFPRT